VFKSRKARKRRDRRAVVVNKSSSEAALLPLELEPIDPACEGSTAYVSSLFYLFLEQKVGFLLTENVLPFQAYD